MDRILPYSSTSRPPERNKWLTYALNLKPRQRSQSVDPITARIKDTKDFEEARQTANPQNRAQFYDNLYQKYPKAFQRRTSDVSVTSSRTSLPVRSSRRLFNSGLHVHFDDSDRDGSVYSEVQPSLNKWITRENDRNCLTSPTPSLTSDISVKQRLHDTSDKLKFLLNHRSSPHRRQNESRHRNGIYKMDNDYSYPEKYSRNVDQIQLLEQELEWKEKQLQKFRRKLQYDTSVSDSSNPQNTHYSNLNFNSESPPDSAIDLDTLSLQSHVSMDTVNVLANEINVDDLGSYPSLDESHHHANISGLPLSQLDEEALELQMSLYTDKAPEHTNMKQAYKDSDVDSGIVQSARGYVTSDMEADNSQLDISSHNRSLDEDITVMPEPSSKPKPKIIKKNGSKISPPKPLKADHNLQIFIPTSEETEDDDSIKQELLNAQLSRDFKKLPQFPVYGNDSGLDDVDDSDPRLGIPEVRGNENEVAARYHSRRSPSPYTLGKSKFVIKSRPQSAPLFGKENKLRYVNISPRNVDSGNDGRVREKYTKLKNQVDSQLKEGDNKSERLTLNQQTLKTETSSPNKTSRTPSSSSNSTLSDNSYSSLVLSLDQNLLPQRNDIVNEKENLDILTQSNQTDVPQTNQGVQYEDRIPTPKNVDLIESERECFNTIDAYINSAIGDDTKIKSCDYLLKDDNSFITDVPFVKLSPFENADVGHGQMVKKQKQTTKLTPYEAALSLDEGGVSVEEIIESDSDNIYSAKKVFLHKPSKHDVLPKAQGTFPITDSREDVQCNGKEIGDFNGTIISDESESLSGSEEQEDLPSDELKDGSESISELKNQNGRSDSEMIVTDHSQLSEKKEDNIDNDTSEAHQIKCQVTQELSETTKTNHVTVPVTGHVISDVTGHETSEVTGHETSNAKNLVTKEMTEKNVDEKSHTNKNPQLHSGKSDQRNPPISNETSGNINKVNGTKTSPTKNHNKIDDNIVTLETEEGDGQVPESNLVKTKGLSASRQSLSDKMENIKKSAKGKFKAIRKAVSMDRGLNKPSLEMEQSTTSPPPKQSKGKMPKMKKALSLKNLFSKKKSKHGSVEFLDHISPYTASDDNPTMQHSKSPNHPIARISELGSDGTQIISLKKRQETKPLGIYIARGNQQFQHGIFISRFSEQKNVFAGVVNIGDQILEINGISVENLTLDEVYDILGTKPELTMKILPLLARKDI